MAEDELEKFEITDYDLQTEFQGASRRKGLTKEQQIYGIWAENSGEDEDDGEPIRPSFGGSNKYLGQGGLNFVAGGIHQVGKKKKKKEPAKQDDDADDDDDLDEMPKPMFGNQLNSSDEDEDTLPLEMISRRRMGAGPSSSNRRGTDKGREIAGFRRAGGTNISDGGIGDWEKHTTGIGSKLMKMMGYEEGKGLGKNLQGIATPVEANKRKGKGAIGFYGSERSERSKTDYPSQDSDEEEKTQFEEQLQQWKKTGSKRKIKYIFKSAEEVIQEGKTKKTKPKTDNHITKTKVIDMTGPETRVLSSYHAIAGQKSIVDEFDEVKKKKYENFDLPELIHNLQILLEKSEDDIVRNAKTLEREDNRIVHLNHERERYETILDREAAEVSAMEVAMSLIETLDTKHNNGVLSFHDAACVFQELKDKHTKVFDHYGLAHLAPTYVSPILKKILTDWDPLVNPQEHLKTIGLWQSLVERDELYDAPIDPYHQILLDTWVVVLRSAILNDWEPRNSRPLVEVFETWIPPLIPATIHSQLLHQVVLQRITRAVNEWNPMEDTVPIHTWLHPWLPLLAEHLQSVYPVIRQKLTSALTMWHPSDQSAKMVLQPWKDVFSEVSMTVLLQTSIQPKLEAALMEMPISPHNQKLNAWHWFALWEDLFPPQLLLDILERCFFHRWYQALGAWLAANPPYTEVVAWYKGWRDSMPKKVVSHPQVRQKLQQYLEICRRAFAYQPGAVEQFALLLSGLDNLLVDPVPPPPPVSSPPRRKDWENIISSARRENLSMKEVVERRCQEREVVFHPIPDKNYEGRPVYRCGRCCISFNKNIIYLQTDRGWMPKSLTSVLDEA